MTDQKQDGRTSKAPYQPPQVVNISLRPEEAVLGHCKVTGSGTGYGLAGCHTVISMCRSQGS